MRTYFKYFLFSALLGAFCCLFYINQSESVCFSDIILKFSFSEFVIHISYLAIFSAWFLPLLVFQALFGTYIYRHFCSASVYYFSRCGHRVSWFIKEAVSLYPYTIIYLLIMLSTGTIIAGITNHLYFDKASLLILIYYLLVHSLWLYLTTLLINILAIKLSSGGAFIIVAGFQIFCIALFAYWGNNPNFGEYPLQEKYARILQFNPLSHLVIGWHSSRIDIVNEKINALGMQFDLNRSIVLFFLLSIVVISAGCLVVKKQDFIVTNIETGGI